MKELFYDLFIQPFKEEFLMDYVLGGVMWILAVFIIAVLYYFSVFLIDSSFMPVKENEGVIIDKYIVPERTTITYVMSGKVLIPITNHQNSTYNLVISIDELEGSLCVDESYYNNVSVGQKVHCRYTNGRIKKSLYGFRLCVCLPLHKVSSLPQMLMGRIAQNRCYTLARLIKR